MSILRERRAMLVHVYIGVYYKIMSSESTRKLHSMCLQKVTPVYRIPANSGDTAVKKSPRMPGNIFRYVIMGGSCLLGSRFSILVRIIRSDRFLKKRPDDEILHWGSESGKWVIIQDELYFSCHLFPILVWISMLSLGYAKKECLCEGCTLWPHFP